IHAQKRKMKTAIIISSILCCAYSIKMSAQTPSPTPTCTPLDQDNFNSSSAWTPVDSYDGNGSIRVAGSAITFSNADPTTCATNHGACNGRELRLWRPLNGTLSNTS